MHCAGNRPATGLWANHGGSKLVLKTPHIDQPAFPAKCENTGDVLGVPGNLPWQGGMRCSCTHRLLSGQGRELCSELFLPSTQILVLLQKINDSALT